ncbi:sensor histidine kinase [Gordonibacter sp.]|uniref:sensor histidine kinase n=1 Tax=Gordonibacter sp. TaxID=1968902 RepID=UPI002FCB7F3D
MSLSTYLRDRFAAVFIGILCCVAVGGMLAVLGVGRDAAVLIPCFIASCGAVALGVGYVRRYRFYRELSHLVDNLDRTYFASELLETPEFLEGKLAHEALEAVGKAAADDVAQHRQQAEAYREYIELWIHEIKTPIAAARLMMADLRGPEAAKLKGEIDRIESSIEQALFYARSTSLAHDYAIREVALAEAVRTACRKNARYLIERGVTPAIEVAEDVVVFADSSWLAFILGQILVNAAKYGAANVRFVTCAEGAAASPARTVLEVADDGLGIPAADVPRVFDRGFTGQNGRAQGSATGMGLYLVATLCEKMGLGVALASEEGLGTRVMLSFPHDRRRLDMQR